MGRGKTQAQHDRQQERKRQRKMERANFNDADWKACEWCGARWNPPKVPVWLGRRTCPQCAYFPRRQLHRLLEFKIVKLRKHSKLPPLGRKSDWGLLGTFNPDLPWMRWVKCAFCDIPLLTVGRDQQPIKQRALRGHIICSKCLKTIRLMISELEKMGYLKVRKPK